MADSGWSEAVQIDQSTGLWFKFKQHPNGDWNILCSGDKKSLESDSVIYHDHYFQRNGTWYFQGNYKGKHTIGRDQFLDSSANKQDADTKARSAYGNSGYDPSSKIFAIEASSFCNTKTLDQYVQQFQAQSTLQISTDEATSFDFLISSNESNSQTITGNRPVSLSGSTLQSTNTVQSTMTYAGGTDTRILLVGLKEYQKTLENHLARLTSEYQLLEGRWKALNCVFEGDYADQLRRHWSQTESGFKSYINQSQKIKTLLNERISALEDLNRQESGLS